MSEAEKTSKPGFFKSVKSEFKKCTWPKKEDLVKQSALVIVVSVLLGVLLLDPRRLRDLANRLHLARLRNLYIRKLCHVISFF